MKSSLMKKFLLGGVLTMVLTHAQDSSAAALTATPPFHPPSEVSRALGMAVKQGVNNTAFGVGWLAVWVLGTVATRFVTPFLWEQLSTNQKKAVSWAASGLVTAYVLYQYPWVLWPLKVALNSMDFKPGVSEHSSIGPVKVQ